MSITIHSASMVPEGDGISVRRLMPVREVMHFDPFVLFDHFDIEKGGFPPHPHRGFEAITWMLKGAMRHKDDLGNEGTVEAGGAQCFTAGRGITHSEMPDGHAEGIQLWINLPKRLKRIEAAYQQVDAAPSQEENGVSLRFIVGNRGAIRLHTDAEFAELDMSPDSHLKHDIDAGWQGIVYVAGGGLVLASETTGDVRLAAGDAAFVKKESFLTLHSAGGARVMWCFGVPHQEPIRQHGPFVD